MTAAPLPATAGRWQDMLLSDENLLQSVAFAVGGPFHVMFPAQIGANIRRFQTALMDAEVDGRIYYAKKANKAACAVRACAENQAGVEVSSVGELCAALAGGVRGESLMVTGPAKSTELLWLAGRHSAIVAIDSVDELRLATAIAARSGTGERLRVLLRVRAPGTDSRFGLTPAELSAATGEIGAGGPVQLEGFSFHLAGYDPEPRAELAGSLLERCVAARAHGHPARMISIGGGFAVTYTGGAEWREFTNKVVPQWFHREKQFVSYYPYHSRNPGAQMLAAVLHSGGLAQRLRDNGITLAIEPGRALLADAGCTVFGVRGVHPADGYDIITVNGTSFSLSEQWFGSEYLPDPLLWPPAQAAPRPACVGGATCLEEDMLSWRRIPLPRPAQRGDLLVYPNTAGYQMDSNESRFQELPLPPKVVVLETDTGLRWQLDGDQREGTTRWA